MVFTLFGLLTRRSSRDGCRGKLSFLYPSNKILLQFSWTHFPVNHKKWPSKRPTLTRDVTQYETKRDFSTSPHNKQNKHFLATTTVLNTNESSKRSGYGSLRAGTRHHGEFLCYGNSFPPTFPEDLLAHASPNDWPIVAKHTNTSSRGSINVAPATITSESDTERRLAERAAITAITVMSHSRSEGTEVTIVTGAFSFELSRDITENFSVMGTLFNPTVREATGSLYQLHSEVEFPSITALVGRAHSW